MLGSLLLVTVVYCLGVLAIIFPPTEMVSAGLTVEGVLDSWLGSENINFIQYHIHRTTARLFIHSFLFPGGYYTLLLFLLKKVSAISFLSLDKYS